MTTISANSGLTAKERSQVIKVLSSPRFYATALAVTLVILGAVLPNFPINSDELTKIVAALAAYVIATSIRPHS